MTIDIGLNSDIHIADRKLHLQTSYSEEKQSASVAIFDSGVMVNKKEFLVKDSSSSSQIEKEVTQFHELVKTDVELLFHMAAKVDDSKHLPSITHLGHLFLERGFYKEAIEQFEFAKQIGGDEVNSDIELSKAYFYGEDYSAAEKQLSSAIEKYPEYPDLHLLLAKTFWNQQKFVEARNYFEQATVINEGYWDAYYSLAYLLVQSTIDHPLHPDLATPIERIKEAEENFKKAIRLNSELNVELVDAGLEKCTEPKSVQDALIDFEHARNAEPQGQLFDSEFYLKFMFGQLDDSCQTLDYYIHTIENVLVQNPNYADLRHSLGVAYLLKGWQCFGKATGEFEKAVDINPLYEKAKKKLRLMQNDGRGLLILLRAILS
jgi:tetratricopeptide (TPR) repeat protein